MRIETFLLATCLLTVACAQPERPLLEQFFSASRLRDLTVLNTIATTIFEPREQGTIASFDITSVVKRQEGDHEVKDVTIVAPVHRPDGEYERKTLVVTLEQRSSGWRVIDLKSIDLK